MSKNLNGIRVARQWTCKGCGWATATINNVYVCPKCSGREFYSEPGPQWPQEYIDADTKTRDRLRADYAKRHAQERTP